MDKSGSLIVVAMILSVAALGTTGIVLSQQSYSISVHPGQNISYVTNSTLGLILYAEESNGQLTSGNNITLSVQVNNTRMSLNILAPSHNYPELAGNFIPQSYACAYLPYGLGIARGNFTVSDLNQAVEFNLIRPGVYSCPMIPAVDQFQFLPHSYIAKMYNSQDSPPYVGETNFHFSENYSGYWTGGINGPTFHSFEPGIYTVIAADGWGQVTLLHFQVSS